MSLQQSAAEYAQHFADVEMDVLYEFEQMLGTIPDVHAYSSSAQHPTPYREPEKSSATHASDKRPVSVDRKQRHRFSQTRYRQRQKAISHDVKAQLAACTAELSQLRVRHQQLQARNSLLEIAESATRQQPSIQAIETTQVAFSASCSTVQDDIQASLRGISKESEQGPIVTVTIDGPEQMLTMDQVSRMSFEQFSRLYSMYAKRLGQCLLEAPDDGKSATKSTAGADMHVWVTELTALMVCTSHGPMTGVKAFQTVSMEDQNASVQELPDSFYKGLLTAWDLTDAQVHDLLYARYLFRCKCGHLINAHVELMRQLEGVSSTQSSSQASIVDLTDQLQVLNNEGYKSYMLYSSLFYRGVCPCLSLTTNQM